MRSITLPGATAAAPEAMLLQRTVLLLMLQSKNIRRSSGTAALTRTWLILKMQVLAQKPVVLLI
jgi:hypothetical protein